MSSIYEKAEFQLADEYIKKARTPIQFFIVLKFLSFAEMINPFVI